VFFSEIRHTLGSVRQQRCENKERWRQRPRWCYLIKTLIILPVSIGRTNIQNSLDFLTALLAERHKRGRWRHRGGFFEMKNV